MILKKEYTAILALALVMAIRMLGLFMILPVFSTHAGDFAYATPQLIGLALGIYGLTQGLLQIPFGLLSDRIGRRPVMSMGLGLFIVGSIIAAFSTSIYGLIIGRAFQGGGAIGSTLLALVADLTRDENRSKAMAIMGMAVGSSFALAMILGPLLNAWVGLSGIFLATAILAGVAELMIWLLLPTPPAPIIQESKEIKGGLLQALKDRRLFCLDVSIFLLHAILTIFFMAIPRLFQNMHLTHLAESGIYLVVLLLAFLFMLGPLILAEKKQYMKSVFLGSIFCLCLAQILLGFFHQNVIVIGLLLLLFLTAFSLLEAVLPSWVSKVANLRFKGFIMGCYSSAQFLGIFMGGLLGGWFLAHYGVIGVFILGAALSLIWIALVSSLSPPPYLMTVILNLRQFSEKNLEVLSSRLYGIAGVTEVAIMTAEDLIYLKINPKVITKPQLLNTVDGF